MNTETGPDKQRRVQIATERLILREVEEDDWPLIAVYLAKPDVTRYMLSGQENPLNAMRFVKDAVAQASLQRRTYYGLGITLKSEGNLIGTCVLDNSLEGGLAQMGWDLDSRYWGQGIMTEAVSAMIDFGFEHLHIRSIQAHCFLENRASIRVMEKAGMHPQELQLWEEQRLMRHYGDQRRLVSYCLTGQEWKESKGWA